MTTITVSKRPLARVSVAALLLALAACGAEESEHAGHQEHAEHAEQPEGAEHEGHAAAAAHGEHEHQALPAVAGMDERATLHDLDVAFTDQSGAALRLADLRGTPVLIAMFYGSCTTICPLILSDLARIAEEAADPRLRVVAVTFDPERDTAERLQAIATERSLSSERWRLLRASEEGTRDVAMALGVQYRRLPNGEFSHSALITLLDAQGHVVARHEGVGQPLETIIAAARNLASTTPAPSPAAAPATP